MKHPGKSGSRPACGLKRIGLSKGSPGCPWPGRRPASVSRAHCSSPARDRRAPWNGSEGSLSVDGFAFGPDAWKQRNGIYAGYGSLGPAARIDQWTGGGQSLPEIFLKLWQSRLFACLEIKTVVTVVLGLLALERKVIVMSTRPSLVLDVCELLRSLLFPCWSDCRKNQSKCITKARDRGRDCARAGTDAN